MKKIYLLAIMFFVGILSMQAQNVRLNGYAGYVFDDEIDRFNDYSSYVNGKVNGGFQYGGSVEFLTPHELGVELLYMGQNTSLPLNFNSGFLSGARSGVYDINLNYALVSLNKYSREGMMEGYGGLMMGCLFTDVSNPGNMDSLGTKYGPISTSGSHFTWGLKLGANMWVAKNIAIKLQAQFLSTTKAVGGSDYYGSYGYYGTYYYGYYEYVNLFQWNFSTGLVFNFGGHE